MTDPTKRSLSNDIRLLGDTLGDVLRAHGGEALFTSVEAMRRAAKEAREAHDEEESARRAREALAAEARRLGSETALEVARAFTLYFQLVNLAEDVHRTRELRRREMDEGEGSTAESLAQAVDELVQRGFGRDDVMAALGDVSLEFVFTAHPTEARRRTTERLLVDVRVVLEDLDRRILTPTETRVRRRRLRAAVEALWEHAAERRQRPEVLEEVKAGLWYLRHVLLDAVPRMHRRLERALSAHFEPVPPTELRMPIAFGSWMGGDRDGNPFVTDAVTERALELHHFIACDRYEADLAALVDPLSAVSSRLPRFPRLVDALKRAEAAVPEVVREAEHRNPEEPLRRLLTYMRERIRRTRTFSAGAYASPEAFIEDLTVLRDQLVAASAEALPNDDLLDLIFRVRCFGFHLASVEVREDARVHRRVVGELLGDPQYPDRSDAERRAALEELRLPQRLSDVSDEARRLLSLFDTFRRLQARFGERAIHTYIMSMAQSAADVFEVKRLAELHGCGSSVDIVPLLETRSALENASTLLEELLSDDAYRNHLEGRRCEQELLVGYSDSMKESGVLASRALVLEAQRAASRVAKDAGIALRIFHGRGGSVSRGGGPTHRAIRALPGDAFSGQMKITEQGETRAFHFGNPDLAVRYLEQSLGAALITRTTARSGQLQRPKDEADLLPQLADTSARAYRRLVEDEGTLEYFRQATPLAQIGSLNIASRPARRGQGRPGLDDLRAIPWVFAWSQARHVITGWFGVGTALESVLAEEDGLARLQRLYEQSPFFFDLLDNVQMTLAKTDLPIASRYAELCRDAAIRDRVFGAIRDEHDRTVDAVLRVTGQSALLDEDPVVKRSIRLRNPYVDPLSYLQVEALRRLQDEAEEQARPPRGSVPPSAADGGWERVARVAVQGISAGLRNTG